MISVSSTLWEKYSSMSFLPNSRLAKEFAVIWPTNPKPLPSIPPVMESWKKRSAKGTASE